MICSENFQYYVSGALIKVHNFHECFYKSMKNNYSYFQYRDFMYKQECEVFSEIPQKTKQSKYTTKPIFHRNCQIKYTPRKVVINTFHSSIYLSSCIKSLEKSDFFNYHDGSDLLIVSSGYNENKITKIKIKELCHDCISNSRIVLVKQKKNNLDLTGLNSLQYYKDHPLISSGSYLYVLDSTTFDKHFPLAFDSFVFYRKTMYSVPLPNSNIVFFENNNYVQRPEL